MWQQNWQAEQAKPTNGVDWASAAQQWMENKKFYEQWQQQTYQQHMQMMAAAHAAQMAQCIDPTVVSNPPPPPPDSSTALRKEADLASRLNDSGEGKDESKADSDAHKSNAQFSKFKNQHLLNNPKLVSTGIMPNKSKVPYVGKDLTKSALAANEQIKSAMGLNEENLEKYLNDAPDMAQLSGTDMTDKNQKQLPLWLREGLEKIKQEKEKKKNDPPKPTIETVFSKDSDSDDSEEDAKQQVRKDRLQQASNESKLPTSALKNGKTSASSSGKHAEQPSAGRLSSYTSSSSSKLELNDDEKQELIV